MLTRLLVYWCDFIYARYFGYIYKTGRTCIYMIDSGLGPRVRGLLAVIGSYNVRSMSHKGYLTRMLLGQARASV